MRVARFSTVVTAIATVAAALAPVAKDAPSARIAPVAAAAARERVARITPHAPAYPPGHPLPDGELPQLRTAFSRTYVEGRYRRVRINTVPVNYLDANGAWQKIDPTLVARENGGWRNAAGDTRFELPSTLAEPVRVARGSDALTFALAGATGTPTVKGASVTYAGALPATDVRYDVLGHALKESLVLRGRTAPSAFAFDVTATPGLDLRATPHGIDAVKGGAAAFTLLPPNAVDAAGAVAPRSATKYALTTTAAGQSLLTLTVDPLWLAAPGRAFPVTVDPTASAPADTTTYIEGGSLANTNFSGLTYVKAGWDSTNSAAMRALLDFDVRSVMPVNSIALQAELGLYSQAVSSGTAPAINIYAAGKPWTSNATWNNYATSSAWTTAGGDVVGSSYWATTVSSTGYKFFYITPLVQKWLDGTINQDGILVRAAAESSGNANVQFGSNLAVSGQGPFLDVKYQARTGLQEHQTYEKFNLTERLRMSVNVGNGNMELESVDNTLSGVGNDLKLAHSYNSMAGPYGLSGDLATNWGFSPGRDVSLGIFTGTVAYYGPSGTADVFISQGGGAYTSPPGANATLTKLSDNTFELKHNKSERTDKFDTTGRLTSMKDRNGNTITIAYNSGAPLQVTSITDTRGRTTSFTYTSGKLTTVTDPLSRTYQFAYDNNYTYLLTYTDPEGGVYTYSYDNNGTLDEVQTPEGNTTLVTYDSAGRVNHVQRVTGTSPQTVADWDFDWFTDYTTVTDPNSHTTRYDFEATQGKVDTVTDALGNDRSVTYTSNSDVATAVDAIGAGNTTTNSYNPNNTLASTTIPTGASVAFTYTDSSHPFSATTQTDAQGNSSLMTYDGPGNLSSVKDTTGGANTTLASYTYNPASPSSPTCGGKYGQRCTMVNGRSKTTTFAYDSSGQLTSVTPPSPLPATSFGSYDSVSRVGTVTDGKSQVTRYTYDNLDHVTEIKFGGATTCTPSSGNCVQYTYDDDGNMLTMVDSTGTTTYAYDMLNRQTSKSFPGGGTAASVTYDGVGNVLTYTDAGGTVTYAYNAANQLVSLAEPSGSCTSLPKVKCTEFEYNENGKRKKTTYPGSTVMETTYDNSGRPSRVKTTNGLTTIADFQYTYTKSGNDTALTQTMTNTAGAVTTYTYDTLNQLSKAVLGGGSPASWLYCYDLAGNRTSYSTVSNATCPGATTTYTYNDANELTAKNGSSTGWSYDNNGNETAGVGSTTRTSETFNTKNQYTGVTVGGSATTMSYAGRDNTERVTASGVTFQNAMLGLASRNSGGSTTYYTRDPDGTLISVRSSTGSSYYVFDGLGSVAALVSSAGVTVNSYTYDPYGAIRSSSETVTNNFKFTGAYYDSDKQLYKLGMRYYDPTLGRFTQQDPTAQEANMYVYAANNPVNFTDPTGAEFQWGAFGEFIADEIVLAGGIAAMVTLFIGCAGSFGLGCLAGAALLGLGIERSFESAMDDLDNLD